MKNNYLIYFILFISLIACNSCKKYLDAKPDKQLVIPQSVSDLQGLLDYVPYMNKACSEATEIASDNYYLTDVKYAALPTDVMRDAYLWKPNIFVGGSNNDWVNEYNIVYNANVVLDNIVNIERDQNNSSDYDNCKGSALYFRGKAFFEIAQIWTKAYDSSKAKAEYGIPLRMTSDFNALSVRSDLYKTYQQIIQDLNASIPLLPDAPFFPYRPSKPAAYGMLARTYLAMSDFRNARINAAKCLGYRSELLDYNTLNTAATYSFSALKFTNPEDIQHTTCLLNKFNLSQVYGTIDTALFNLYDTNDCRRTVFFRKSAAEGYYFRGSYDGSNFNYNGVATDEVYLIRAECSARAGDVTDAMNDLNALLVKRWKTSVFIPLTAVDKTDALNQILIERRKELVYRMQRFTDIKRLNLEGANITIKREVNGQEYLLPPNDPRYALPIPQSVIQISGMQQN